MTKRADIEQRLIYTCNCGWVDKGHAALGIYSRPRSDPSVGVVNLWKQIKSESIQTSDTINGRPCFHVHYRQEMGIQVSKRSILDPVALSDGSLMKASFEDYYLVRKGLLLHRKESIALRIFLVVSYGFEAMQDSFPFVLVSNSGYSQEDLISNIIGFYSVVRGLSDNTILDQICKAVSKTESLKVWDAYFSKGGIGAVKNKDHTKPNYYPCKKCQNPLFPAIFKSIWPANYGNDFIRYNRNPLVPSNQPTRNFNGSGMVMNNRVPRAQRA